MRCRKLLFVLMGLLVLSPALQAGPFGKRDRRRSSRRSKKDEGLKYVSVPTAQLKDGKTVSASVVREVTRGTKLKVVDEGDGRWLQVAMVGDSSAAGWIYFNKVVDQEPRDLKNHLVMNRGIRTDDLETSGAIRGLKGISQDYAKKKAISKQTIGDLHRIQTFPFALQQFDKNRNGNLDSGEQKQANDAYRKWIEANLKEFLKEGGLGEYAQ